MGRKHEEERYRTVTVIVNEAEADIDAIAGQKVAVIGYGNQGRSWALNLRDSGLDVGVYTPADPSREKANSDGFESRGLGRECSALRFESAISRVSDS
jgi:ketol-acid reductoisomerase